MSSELHLLLEKATSPLLLEVDIPNTLQIVDLIRQNDVSPKLAVQGIFQRLKDKNPNVVLMTLQVLEYVVKNCGEAVHEEVCSRASCELIEDLIRTNTNEEVRSAACYLLGSWCSAFKGQQKLQAIQDLANILRAMGHQIPLSSEAAALYCADAAPDWADASCCHRCRSNFSLLKRKHHCRACGQVFCNECSGRVSNIPKFGIEKDVRVCENCYHQINNPSHAKSKSKDESTVASSKKTSTGTTNNSNSSTNSGGGSSSSGGGGGGESGSGGGKNEAELREEEELQLALALSKSEAENKEKEKLRVTSSLLSGGGWRVSAPPHSPSPPPLAATTPGQQGGEEEGELAKYLNRSYWEQQQKQQDQQKQQPATINNDINNAKNDLKSAGEDTDVIGVSSQLNAAFASKVSESLQTCSDPEMDEFVRTFRTQLEIFVNRMKSNQSRGRPIANDTSVQSLFVNITAMHGQLLHHLQQQEKNRVWYEQLQDKLSQSRDARAALEALREEHRERERREKEEQQRVRQMQMMQKLEVMRKKKQEYLEYQRQLAVHRMAQAERQIMTHQQQPMGYYSGPQSGTLPHSGAMDQQPQHLSHPNQSGGAYPVPPALPYQQQDPGQAPYMTYMTQPAYFPGPGAGVSLPGGAPFAPSPAANGGAPLPTPDASMMQQQQQQQQHMQQQQHPMQPPNQQPQMQQQQPMLPQQQQPMMQQQTMVGPQQQQQTMVGPQQQQQTMVGPQQQHPQAMPGQQPIPTGLQPQPGAMNPAHQQPPVMPVSGMMLAQQQQPQQQQQQDHLAELISFD